MSIHIADAFIMAWLLVLDSPQMLRLALAPRKNECSRFPLAGLERSLEGPVETSASTRSLTACRGSWEIAVFGVAFCGFATHPLSLDGVAANVVASSHLCACLMVHNLESLTHPCSGAPSARSDARRLLAMSGPARVCVIVILHRPSSTSHPFPLFVGS